MASDWWSKSAGAPTHTETFRTYEEARRRLEEVLAAGYKAYLVIGTPYALHVVDMKRLGWERLPG